MEPIAKLFPLLLVAILFGGVVYVILMSMVDAVRGKPTTMASGTDHYYGIPNMDPANGIRYGVISLNSLDSDVLEALTTPGYDVSSPDADEEEYRGEYEGVKFRIAYGAMPIMWVTGGYVGYGSSLCSPCVPNAVDLDESFQQFLDDNHPYFCYIIPKYWIEKVPNA